jgi:hypothetical protein
MKSLLPTITPSPLSEPLSSVVSGGLVPLVGLVFSRPDSPKSPSPLSEPLSVRCGGGGLVPLVGLGLSGLC